jgi:hypothetical protein
MQFIKKHFFVLCPLILFAVSIIYSTIMLHTPQFRPTSVVSFRWNDLTYTQTVDADDIARYTHERDVLMLEEIAGGTRVTVELFPAAPKTYTITENGTQRQVFDESGALQLEGKWGQSTVGGKTETGLLDSVRGDMIFEYRQQLGWNSPTAAIALNLYEASKSASTATDSLLPRIVLIHVAAVILLLRVYFPMRRREQETYEAIPLVRGLLTVVVSLMPLLSSMIIFS